MEKSRKEQLIEMLKKSPGDPFLHYALAIEWISEGNDPEAEPILFELLKNHPRYSATYYHLGKLLERENRIEEAEALYKKGIEVTRENGETRSNREMREALTQLLFNEE